MRDYFIEKTRHSKFVKNVFSLPFHLA